MQPISLPPGHRSLFVAGWFQVVHSLQLPLGEQSHTAELLLSTPGAMVAPEKLLTVENPVFQTYLFYSSVLAVKMIAMTYLTSKTRLQKLVFANPEDTTFNPKKSKVKYDDPDIERIRRAHLNDLENIPLFLIVALVYIASDPNPFIATNIFRIFTAARIFHSIVYAVYPLPQPARFLTFFVGNLVTVYMTIQGFRKFTF